MTTRPLVAKQARSVQLAQRRINIWEGSVRSSKTVCSMLAWIGFVLDAPPGNLAMVGKTHDTLKRNIIDPLTAMLGEENCRHNRGERELLLLGRRIYLAGANDKRSEDKIRGLTLAGAYVDEISIIPEGFFKMLLSRLSVDGARLFGTTNPDSRRHWLMRKYLRRARIWLDHDGRVKADLGSRLDLARFSFQLADNPTLSAEYIAALDAEFTGLWHKRFIQGLWVLAEGAIFDTFDPDPGGVHVVTAVPDDIDEWVLAVDYGTVNPFVALLLGHAPGTLMVPDRMYCAREWRWDSSNGRGQLTDDEYSRRLRAWLPGLRAELGDRPDPTSVIVDPSAASFINQLYRDSWYGVTGADNSVADGLRSVASLLAADRLKIHASCSGDEESPGLIDEMAGYVWDAKASEEGGERPVKVDDHGPDALRYGVMGTRRWWRWWLTDQPEAA